MIRERRQNGLEVSGLTLAGLALLFGLRMVSAADEMPLPAHERRERDARAAKLVEEALRKRVVGADDEVRELTALAVATAPDFAPARWQRGEIRRNGRWMSLEELQKQGEQNENLVEYGRQRDSYARIADPIWLNYPSNVAAPESAPSYMHKPRKSMRYLRKSFELPDKPQFAQLQLRIQGKAEVFLNGHHMMRSKSARLSGVEKASDQLRNGKNIIAVSIQGASEQQVPGVRLWLEGVSHDHRIFTIPTDGTWKVSAEAADGWRDAQFDDGQWEAAAATPLSMPEGELAVEQPISAPLEAALARWCQAHALPEPAHFHWTRLLYYQPQNAEAMKALGLVQYRDKLLTKEQLEIEKKTERDARVALARWQPIFEKMKANLDRGTPKAIESARARLHEADLGAIPAFEAVLNEFAETDGAPSLAKEVIEQLLARFPDREATAALARLAKDHSRDAVRNAAIEALKPRDLLDFVPPLMGALQSPIEVQVTVTQEPAGLAVCTAKYFHKGVEVDDERTEVFKYDAREDAESSNQTANAEARQAALRRATLKKGEIETAIAAQNLKIDRSNERILNILQQVTGLDHGPALTWWTWWRDYNELLIPKNTVRETSFSDTEFIRYDGSRRVREEANNREFRERDCFAKGTPVWTLAGLRSIETIKLGDPVLAQDPETGELAFKVVLGTSIRPASPMVRLRVGDETITSTRGHRYWKEGHGWRMAKNLAAGDKLHSVEQSLSVDEVLATPDESAYNLVVEGFNSYFVGRQAILVHDTGAPRPTTALVPGLHR